MLPFVSLKIKTSHNMPYYFVVLFQDVQGMMSISTEAAAARSSLNDDKELINTYEVGISVCFYNFF